MRSFSTTRRSRRWMFGAAAAVGALTMLGVAGVVELRATPSPASTESSTPAAVGPHRDAAGRHRPLPTKTSTAVAPADPAAHEVERLRALPAVAAGRRAEAIAGEAILQPDLYAAEFVRRLLTQDYRTSRESQLRWVQAESALTREPLVVGLIPAELRYRYALFRSPMPTTLPLPSLPTPSGRGLASRTDTPARRSRGSKSRWRGPTRSPPAGSPIPASRDARSQRR